ncbi:unannotated protein [freshwater metagenome]|uniref:Unannotated protein n=1 Tax=freshwater metagenome TaxID=449393 RepID=A0A6J6I3T3_9ZZZZ
MPAAPGVSTTPVPVMERIVNVAVSVAEGFATDKVAAFTSPVANDPTSHRVATTGTPIV